jgi:glycosyltransferase involved in cell wall biosynthesis
MNKPSVVMVTDHHVDSGIGYYSLELGRAMQSSCSVQLVKPYRSDHPDSYLHQQYSWIKKAHYKSLRQLRPYILPLFLRKSLTGTTGAVYHAHWFLAGLSTTYAHPGPRLVTMHDVSLLHVSDSNDKYLQYYRWGINRFRKKKIPLIVVSEQARQDTITYAAYPQDLVYAVHNGINFDHFYPVSQTSNTDRFTLVYSGGLGKRKNLDLLLRAYQWLQLHYDFLELKIAGSHPERTPYPALVQTLGLQNVTFTGFVPDDAMNAFYNSGDLMVYTSGYEGFGMAPLEGMACGLPVVSTRGGALAEVSGGGAHLVGYEEDELVSAIRQIVDDSTYRWELSQRGQAWVKQYTWKNAAEKTLDIYQKIW